MAAGTTDAAAARAEVQMPRRAEGDGAGNAQPLPGLPAQRAASRSGHRAGWG